MRKSIQNKLREGLLKEFGVKQLDFDTNNMNVDISPEYLENIKALQWNDIKLEDMPSNDNTRFKFHVGLPFENDFENEIKLAIDLKGGTLYQLDISIPNKLQGLGLGPKIYKAVIMDFGHVYSAKARVHNPNIYKIFDKLRQDSDIECIDGKSATICSARSNPDKDKLFNVVKGL